MRFLKIALIGLALIIFIMACDQTPTGSNSANSNANKAANNSAANNANAISGMPVNAPQETAQTETERGRKIFMEICANCHKEDGTGGKVTIEGKTLNPDNLTTEKMQKMSDEKYVDYIKNGVPDEGMPAFKDKLNDAEIQSVISFIRNEIHNKN